MARTHDERRRIASDIPGAPATTVNARLIIAVIALVALIIFLAQNLQEVEVHFLWFDWSTRMFWALLASTAVGGLATALVTTLSRRRREP